MTFYVYKATGRLSKNVWEMVSELDNYDAAVAAAEKLCPRGGKIETEPGNGLPKAYFGRDYGDRWKAMISKSDSRKPKRPVCVREDQPAFDLGRCATLYAHGGSLVDRQRRRRSHLAFTSWRENRYAPSLRREPH